MRGSENPSREGSGASSGRAVAMCPTGAELLATARKLLLTGSPSDTSAAPVVASSSIPGSAVPSMLGQEPKLATLDAGASGAAPGAPGSDRKLAPRDLVRLRLRDVLGSLGLQRG
jgi:hypothetical protein